MQNNYHPEIASMAKPAARPLVETRALSFLAAHPARWQVLGEQVVPLLGSVKMIPGLLAVQRTRGGQWALHDLRAELDRLGWTLVPHDAVPPEEAAKGRTSIYYQPEGRPDLKLHYCERATAGSRETRCDEARWLRYLSWLVESGTVAAPSLEQLELLEEKLEERHVDAVDKAQKVPSFRARAETHAKQMEVVRSAIEVARAKAGDVAEVAAPVVDDPADGLFVAAPRGPAKKAGGA